MSTTAPTSAAGVMDEAEITVLGAMFISSVAADAALASLSPNDFGHPEHEEIFQAVRGLRHQGLHWNGNDGDGALLVQDELRRFGYLARIGGEEYLARIVAIVPTAANVEHWIGRVKENAEAAGRRSWPTPEKLPREWPEAPTLPEHLLPSPLRAWCSDIATRMQVPLEMVAAPAIVSLAGAVGRTVTIRPKRHDDWRVVPNLWGGVVALPGRMKSPALAGALRPLKTLQREALEAFGEESYSNAASLDALKAQEAAVKGLLKRYYETGRPVQLEGLTMDAAPLKERLCALKEEIGTLPTAVRFLTNDPTVEKLGELLRDSPRGLLLERDELAGWMRSLDRDDRRGDREFYLEGWNGDGEYTYDRIGRGTIHVPALCISIIGGIQPGKLKSYVREALAGGYGADGLIQRFQVLVWPEDRGDWEHIDRPPDGRAQGAVEDAFRRLANWPPEEEPRRFSAEAQALFDEWFGNLERRLRSEELSTAPGFLAHLAKYRSLMPSLALLFHLLLDPQVPEVSVSAAKLAAAWCEFLKAHARKVYAPKLNARVRCAHALAVKIREGEVEDGETPRTIYRNGWTFLQNAEEARASLEILSACGWLRLETEATAGRSREVIRINPHVFIPASVGSVGPLTGHSR